MIEKAGKTDTRSLIAIGIVVVFLGGVAACVYSPANTIVFIGLVGGIVAQLVNLQSNIKQEQNTEKTIQSQVRQEDMQVAQGVVSDATHTLVNGVHGQTLKALALTSRALAEARPNPELIAAAEKAESDLAEHEAKTVIIEESG